MNTETEFDWRTMDRPQQIVLYVVGMLDKLKEMGLVEGGMVETSDHGKKTVEEMELAIEAGEWVSPSMEEIQWALAGLQSMALTEQETVH